MLFLINLQIIFLGILEIVNSQQYLPHSPIFYSRGEIIFTKNFSKMFEIQENRTTIKISIYDPDLSRFVLTQQTKQIRLSYGMYESFQYLKVTDDQQLLAAATSTQTSRIYLWRLNHENNIYQQYKNFEAHRPQFSHKQHNIKFFDNDKKILSSNNVQTNIWSIDINLNIISLIKKYSFSYNFHTMKMNHNFTEIIQINQVTGQKLQLKKFTPEQSHIDIYTQNITTENATLGIYSIDTNNQFTKILGSYKNGFIIIWQWNNQDNQYFEKQRIYPNDSSQYYFSIYSIFNHDSSLIITSISNVRTLYSFGYQFQIKIWKLVNQKYQLYNKFSRVNNPNQKHKQLMIRSISLDNKHLIFQNCSQKLQTRCEIYIYVASNCVNLPHVNKSRANLFINYCNCEKNYIWNRQKGQCTYNCSNTINALRISNENFEQCVCQNNYKWNNNAKSCYLDCNGKQFSNESNKNQNECHCQQNYVWSSISMKCLKNCSNYKYAYPTFSQGDFCQCVPNYFWNNKNCLVNCNQIINAKGFGNKQNQCECLIGSKWNAILHTCQAYINQQIVIQSQAIYKIQQIIHLIKVITIVIVIVVIILLVFYCYTRYRRNKNNQNYQIQRKTGVGSTKKQFDMIKINKSEVILAEQVMNSERSSQQE